MDIDKVVTWCQALLEDVEFAAVARWKAEQPGRRAIGCFPVYTPEELVAAAGMLPVGVGGAGSRIEIDHADSRLQSFICSISRSTLELGLSGRLRLLDGMIFPSTCDVARNLSGVWQRNFPDQWTAYLHFPENIGSAHAEDYLVAELGRLRAGLEALGGRPIGDDDLEAAIAEFDEFRGLVRELYAVKDCSPWLLSSAEVYALVRAGSLLPRAAHAETLRQVLAALPGRHARPRDRLRVVLEGAFCEQPPPELLAVIEEAGCYVVNDDLWLGSRWLRGPVAAGGEPLRRLARAFLQDSVDSAVRYDGPASRGELLVEKCRRHRADGVIFCTAKFCDPALFDCTLMKPALDRAGIPHLGFEFEEKAGTFEGIRMQVETFAESILLFA